MVQDADILRIVIDEMFLGNRHDLIIGGSDTELKIY